MRKRWIVVTENFACLDPERFTYAEFASRGAAEDARNLINSQAILYNWRIRASIRDNRERKNEG